MTRCVFCETAIRGGVACGQCWRNMSLLALTLIFGPFLCWYVLRSIYESEISWVFFLGTFVIGGVYFRRRTGSEFVKGIAVGASLAFLSSAAFVMIRRTLGPIVWIPWSYGAITVGDLCAFAAGTLIAGSSFFRKPADPDLSGEVKAAPGNGTPENSAAASSNMLSAVATEAVKAIATAFVSAVLLHLGLKS